MMPEIYHGQFINIMLIFQIKTKQPVGQKRAFDKPFVVSTSVLGAATHGKASGHTSDLHSQEMVRALTGVVPPRMTDQAQVRAASIVHSTGIVYCQRKSHSWVK